MLQKKKQKQYSTSDSAKQNHTHGKAWGSQHHALGALLFEVGLPVYIGIVRKLKTKRTFIFQSDNDPKHTQNQQKINVLIVDPSEFRPQSFKKICEVT